MVSENLRRSMVSRKQRGIAGGEAGNLKSDAFDHRRMIDALVEVCACSFNTRWNLHGQGRSMKGE